MNVPHPFRIGVDVGGTFTDLVLMDASSKVYAFKSPSVPSNPAEGVVQVVQLTARLLGMDVAALLGNCSLFVHGSTVATNTLLEKKGAKVGLIATHGFRDSLEIRRGIRENVWDHRTPFPPVLVPRRLRRTVAGRLDANGTEIAPLSKQDVLTQLTILKKEQVDAIAICLMHSYANPSHEHAVRDIIEQAWPEIWVTCSSDVAPVVGEYERSSTTVVNAYVAPKVVPYLLSLDKQLADMGLAAGLLMVQSNGGAIAISEIAASPVQLVLSGPAAGVGSLNFFSGDTGAKDVVAIEIGGTSCDVTLSVSGKVGMTNALVVDGYHISIPAVEIHTVGAGGGTIAWVDEAGLLHAGPQGAGARPGPACYGFGGEMPTVTDAQLVLGRLKPGPYAGGAITLDLGKAVEAVRKHVADPLSMTVEAAAAGILRLVEQNVQNAVESVAAENGCNPQELTLIAAGGAGPLHGTPVARALRCKTLYLPRLAGVFCAFGMCNADVRHDFSKPIMLDLDAAATMPALGAALEELRQKGRALLEREAFKEADTRIASMLDMRYGGQQWAVPVEIDTLDAVDIRARFEDVYRRLYGYVQKNGSLQIATVRIAAMGLLAPTNIFRSDSKPGQAPIREYRDVWLDAHHGKQNVPVYEGAVLTSGQCIGGPALIDELTTTILLGVGDELTVTDANNYRVSIAQAGEERVTAAA